MHAETQSQVKKLYVIFGSCPMGLMRPIKNADRAPGMDFN